MGKRGKRIAKGFSGSPFQAEAVVVLVKSKADWNKVKTGVIIVSPNLAPEDNEVMELASGFVTDVGGPGCHAAMVAKVTGKAAVCGIEVHDQGEHKKGQELFSDGQKVIIDGKTGEVWESVPDQFDAFVANYKGPPLPPATLEALKKTLGGK